MELRGTPKHKLQSIFQKIMCNAPNVRVLKHTHEINVGLQGSI